ncbi:hypothetical protein KP509_16G055200 [Ceratopteris richardii]|uniref:Uncharacterized protein n=1 Tax=Ceratopteris richardii TaxID=49495 RepID=A0A8T2T3H6_CERRI|nr:hypothetical protein KP509_16G055200 [Ceratopteris richardii]
MQLPELIPQLSITDVFNYLPPSFKQNRKKY